MKKIAFVLLLAAGALAFLVHSASAGGTPRPMLPVFPTPNPNPQPFVSAQ